MSTPLSEQIETPRASRVITVLKAVRRAPATVLIFCIELYRTYVSPLTDADLPVHPHLQ